MAASPSTLLETPDAVKRVSANDIFIYNWHICHLISLLILPDTLEWGVFEHTCILVRCTG